jgi:hypothetical protein
MPFEYRLMQRRRVSTVPSPGAKGTSGWVVWIALSGVLLVLLGTFHIVQGVGALLTDQRFLLRDVEPFLDLDTTTWGWFHVVVGGLVAAAGFLVFGGQRWARGVGATVALVSALTALSFLSEHPLWALVVIALDVTVVLALVLHGAEIKAG